MRQSGQINIRDLAAHHEVDHLSVSGVAGRADQMLIGRIEEEIVQVVVQMNAAHGERARIRETLARAIVMYGTLVHRLGVIGVADFPHLLEILQGRDEAFSGRCDVYGAYARAVSAIVAYRNHLQRSQIHRIQKHQRMGKVVCHHDIAAIARHGQIAAVDPRTDFGNRL